MFNWEQGNFAVCVLKETGISVKPTVKVLEEVAWPEYEEIGAGVVLGLEEIRRDLQHHTNTDHAIHAIQLVINDFTNSGILLW